VKLFRTLTTKIVILPMMIMVIVFLLPMRKSENDEENVSARSVQSRAALAIASTSAGSAEPEAIAYPSGTELHASTSDSPSRMSDDEVKPTIDDSGVEYMTSWVKNLHQFPLCAPFGDGDSDLQVTMAENSETVDFDSHFITPDIIRMMRVESNGYATGSIQAVRASRRVSSRR